MFQLNKLQGKSQCIQAIWLIYTGPDRPFSTYLAPGKKNGFLNAELVEIQLLTSLSHRLGYISHLPCRLILCLPAMSLVFLPDLPRGIKIDFNYSRKGKG